MSRLANILSKFSRCIDFSWTSPLQQLSTYVVLQCLLGLQDHAIHFFYLMLARFRSSQNHLHTEHWRATLSYKKNWINAAEPWMFQSRVHVEAHWKESFFFIYRNWRGKIGWASNSRMPNQSGGNRVGRRRRGSAAQPPVVLTEPHHRMTYRTSPPLPSPPTNQPTHSFPPLLRLQLLPISRAAPPRRRLPPFPTSPAGLRSCSCRRPVDSPLYLPEPSPWPWVPLASLLARLTLLFAACLLLFCFVFFLSSLLLMDFKDVFRVIKVANLKHVSFLIPL